MKYGTPIGDPIEEGGGKMVFWVIVCIDSYIYIQNNITRTLYRGVPPPDPPGDQKMDPGPIETHV